MDFWPESPASGVEKYISGFFRASGNQNPAFLHPRKVLTSGRAPCPFFYVQNAPLLLYSTQSVALDVICNMAMSVALIQV
jgi:hypothetical protein